jgi:hypothetical protein
VSTTDKPRKIVVCHPDDFAAVNRAAMTLAYGDVLVVRNRYVDVGKSYVMDGDLLAPPVADSDEPGNT